jgi:hypothetical protein
MSLDFRAQQRIVMDPSADLKIYPPRILPSPSSSDVDRVEFQYPIYRGDASFVFFLFGHERVSERNKQREISLILSIDQDWVVEDALQLKAKWNLSGDTFSFLCGLAAGLVGVLALRSNIEEGSYYSALTNGDVLARHGIAVAESAVRNDAGEIILAEKFVPARNNERSES